MNGVLATTQRATTAHHDCLDADPAEQDASGRDAGDSGARVTAPREPGGAEWLAGLPQLTQDLARRWGLTLGPPFEHDGYTAVVLPGERQDGSPLVLKLSFPHMEGLDEAAGLRFWDGEPTVRLLDADEPNHALLLERCVPGHDLKALPMEERDTVLADLLRRLWRPVSPVLGFRHLQEMIGYWSAETERDAARWPDPGLVREGLAVWRELSRPASDDVLLATDAHAGNVLAARREPWLLIDPKPFVGDRAYDATQHLFDAQERLEADPQGLVSRWAGLLGLDEQRVRAWTFARYAAERRDDDAGWRRANAMARRLAP